LGSGLRQELASNRNGFGGLTRDRCGEVIMNAGLNANFHCGRRFSERSGSGEERIPCTIGRH